MYICFQKCVKTELTEKCFNMMMGHVEVLLMLRWAPLLKCCLSALIFLFPVGVWFYRVLPFTAEHSPSRWDAFSGN